jgi:hypothetical protein
MEMRKILDKHYVDEYSLLFASLSSLILGGLLAWKAKQKATSWATNSYFDLFGSFITEYFNFYPSKRLIISLTDDQVE